MSVQSLKMLTKPMFYLLLALYEDRCGIEISEFLNELTVGYMDMGPGTMYELLLQLLEEGLIKYSSKGVGKNYYIITDKGKIFLREEFGRLTDMVKDYRKVVEGESYDKD